MLLNNFGKEARFRGLILVLLAYATFPPLVLEAAV